MVADAVGYVYFSIFGKLSGRRNLSGSLSCKFYCPEEGGEAQWWE